MSDKQHFETGSQRDTDDGKSRFDLMTPFIKQRLGELLRKGAIKYGDNNWLLGQPNSRYWASFTRHLGKYERGENDEDNLSAMIWNLCGIMHNEEVAGTDTEIQVDGEWHKLPKELLDFPIFRQVTPVEMDTINEKGEWNPFPVYPSIRLSKETERSLMESNYQSEIRDLKNMLDETPVNEVTSYNKALLELENTEAGYNKFKESVK